MVLIRAGSKDQDPGRSHHVYVKVGHVCLSCAACADINVSRADIFISCAATCGYRFSYMYFYAVVESAPLEIRGLTPGFVQAALDHLLLNALYTKKLELGRFEPADKDKDQPAHDTRGASKEKEMVNKVVQTMGYSKDIRGKMPKPFSSRTEALRGSAKDFSLANAHELTMLTAYLYLNGKYDLCSTPKDGSCLFSACKWGADFPVEYVNPLMRRDLVCFIAEHAAFFYELFEPHIKGVYGGLRLSKEEYEQKRKDKTITPSEEYEYHHPGPFSFKEYLEYILLDGTWGDELLIVAMSLRWQIAITVVHAGVDDEDPEKKDPLRESRVRHNRPLEEVDLVLVYCGHNHYVGASKYFFSFSSL